MTETSEKRNKCNPWLLQCFTKIFIEFSRAREQAAKPSPLPGGVLPCISRVCAAPKGRVFAPFLSENGRRFCPFFFGIGNGLRGNYDCVSMCSSFQFQMNKKESLICEFDIAWVVYRRPPSLEKIRRGDVCTLRGLLLISFAKKNQEKPLGPGYLYTGFKEIFSVLQRWYNFWWW